MYFLRLQILKRLKIENIAKRTLNDFQKKVRFLQKFYILPCKLRIETQRSP